MIHQIHHATLTGHRIITLGALLLGAFACKHKQDDSTSTSTSTGSTATGMSTDSQGAGSNGSTSAGQSSSGSTADSCAGPEHEAFNAALCPQAYPNCTPYPPGSGWETYCQDHGFVPVGEGECGCTPKAVLCGVNNSDDMEFFCCCPLEDVSP